MEAGKKRAKISLNGIRKVREQVGWGRHTGVTRSKTGSGGEGA